MTLSQSQGRIGSSSCFMPCLSPDECGRWQRLVVPISASPCPVRLLTGRRYGNARAEEIGRLVLSRPPGRDDGASTFSALNLRKQVGHGFRPTSMARNPTVLNQGADGKCQVLEQGWLTIGQEGQARVAIRPRLPRKSAPVLRAI